MNKTVYDNLLVIWNYMQMGMQVSNADCIVGFGSYNEDIAIRAAQLYLNKFSPKILFSGGLGRNTIDMWTQSEAERFADIALKCGVLKQDIIIENKSTNTAENILFTKTKFEELGLSIEKIICVHKPFMERRLYAAMKVYWPEVNAVITSPQLSIEEYISNSMKQGLDEKTIIDVIVGDFQRMEVYAQKGYQIPQIIPDEAKIAYNNLIALGFTSQLVSV